MVHVKSAVFCHEVHDTRLLSGVMVNFLKDSVILRGMELQMVVASVAKRKKVAPLNVSYKQQNEHILQYNFKI